jgi:CRISPR system Cascade subunit CasC
MFLELHLLQNFALSNLNRDDTGAPKSCIFGGARRARISSQCLKRAVRTYFREEGLVPAELLSHRTKWLHRELTDRLAAMDVEMAEQVAARAIELLEFKLDNNKKTQYLLLLGDRELSRLAGICRENAEVLSGAKKEKGSKKDSDGALAQELLAALDGGNAVDVALFGRMIATHAEKNVDAAVQMAHAISTHAVATEFDFYAAVDDLQQNDSDEGAGAGMLGTVLYNASCYYRYANVDLDQLEANLGGNADQADMAVRSFMEGMVHAVPTGKRTNSAPQNPPAVVMAVVRDRGLWSLANAFVKPVRASSGGDLVADSAALMLKHWDDLVGMYDTQGMRYTGCATYLPELAARGVSREPSLTALLDRVMNEVRAGRN